MNASNNIPSPLDSFLDRLELAGFLVSPRERLRVMRIIEGLGKQHLSNPEKLKYLICPIIAQGETDQQKFYELFDQYWKEVKEPWELPDIHPQNTEKSWLQKNSYWLRWFIVSLVLGGLLYTVFSSQTTSLPRLHAHFKHPPTIPFGSHAYFENISEYLDSASTFKWEILDNETDEVEYSTTDSFHLTYPLKELSNGPHKKVRLTNYRAEEDPAVHESIFTVVCNHPPKIDSVYFGKGKIGDPIDFKLFLVDPKGVVVNWEIGGEIKPKLKGTSIAYRFDQEGSYEVKAIVQRENKIGYCEEIISRKVSIGEEKAILSPKQLDEENFSAIVNFSYAMWILLGLLSLPIIWYWVKWATRPAPKPKEVDGEQEMAEAAERFKSNDKAPYKIPFRDLNKVVQIDRDVYRLADVMRQRQEGLRKEVDVPQSVNKTIIGGGFPHLQTKRDEIPTEYLFLVDAQMEGSHQRALFLWLVAFLREREVIGECYFFNEGLHRFWNEDHPNGIASSQLQRQYGTHKLILLGDGYDLLNASPDFARQRPRLRKEAEQLFKPWKDRFLLTPMPVSSWTYREGVLHDRFAIFPMDSRGLDELIKYLEQEVLDEERPPYKNWSRQLLEHRTETDINYRNWRSAKDHREYLQDHPHLYTWLCAIVLYPQPNWNCTLAVGRALNQYDVDVTYDDLLILSRIPWLIDEPLSPRLRHDLINDLDPQVEKLAREALQKELKLASGAVKNGHANLEHQTNLAIQEFAIDPKNAIAQKDIQHLMKLGLLSPKHMLEINQRIKRDKQELAPKLDRSTDTLKAHLAQNKKEPTLPEKPFFTSDFYLALIFTLLFLLLFLFAWDYGGTQKLAKMAGIETEGLNDCQNTTYSHLYFLKKECLVDSAAIWNNEAIGIWKRQAAATLPDFDSLAFADSLLRKAIQVRQPNYELASLNKDRLHYNIGVLRYSSYLEEKAGTEVLDIAEKAFEQVTLDTFALDAMHGRGLSKYYSERQANIEPSASSSIYNRMMLKDSSYFDSLSMYPHLQSLLAQSNQSIPKTISLRMVDENGQSLRGVTYIKDSKTNYQTDANGELVVNMFLGERRIFRFSRSGYESPEQEITAASGVYFYDIKMVKKAVVVEEPTVPLGPGEHAFCYVINGEIFKGSYSYKVQLRQNEALSDLPAIIDFYSEREEIFDVVYKYLNLKWAKSEHAKEYEIDLFPYAERGMRNDKDFQLVTKEPEAWREGSGFNLTFTMFRPTTDIGKLPFYLAIRRKDCQIDDDADQNMEKAIQEDCLAGTISSGIYLMMNDRTIFETRDQVYKNNMKRLFRNSERNMSDQSCSAAELILAENSLKSFTKILDSEAAGLEDFIGLDKDEDGIPDFRDKCPEKKGTDELVGCPEKVDDTVVDPVDPNPASGQWTLIKSNYISEPKILKNRDFYDTFTFDGYDYELTLNSLSNRKGASFTLHKDLKQEARIVEDIIIENLQENGVADVKMDGKTFKLTNLGQGRRRVKAVSREVTLYKIEALSEFQKALPDKGNPAEVSPPQVISDKNSYTDILAQIKLDMVKVQGGAFEMGCPDNLGWDCASREQPVHTVNLESFSISKYEVTWELWDFIMIDNPLNATCKSCPVNKISWEDAQEFIQRLNKETNGGFRLPTEAEWEYAARGGQNSKRTRFSGSANNLGDVGWYSKNSEGRTHQVGLLSPNELGLYDMSGNVSEWCQDWYDENYYEQYQKGGKTNPTGPETGTRYVLRGGNYRSKEADCRVTFRTAASPTTSRLDHVGFRIVSDK